MLPTISAFTFFHKCLFLVAILLSNVSVCVCNLLTRNRRRKSKFWGGGENKRHNNALSAHISEINAFVFNKIVFILNSSVSSFSLLCVMKHMYVMKATQIRIIYFTTKPLTIYVLIIFLFCFVNSVFDLSCI